MTNTAFARNLDPAATALQSDAILSTFYAPGGGFPLFVQPRDPELRDSRKAFLAWFRHNRDLFDETLGDVGAIVFRGFPIEDTQAFGEAVGHYESPRFGYIGGSSPRRQLAPRVFESTYTPAQDVIMLHQEMAYLPEFPSRIAFFCRVPPVSGGETFIADMRRVTDDLDQNFVQEVEKCGVRYQRNLRDRDASTGNAYLDAIHRTWQDSFNTTDRDEAFAGCKTIGLEGEWLPDGSLLTIYRSAGMISHPRTGQRLWFNQISTTTLCPDSIGEERYALHEGYYGTSKPRPYETTYNDGSAIPSHHVSQLYQVLRKHRIGFPWSHGDLLLVDNYITAHGRNSYTGLRDVQVALLA